MVVARLDGRRVAWWLTCHRPGAARSMMVAARPGGCCLVPDGCFAAGWLLSGPMIGVRPDRRWAVLMAAAGPRGLHPVLTVAVRSRWSLTGRLLSPAPMAAAGRMVAARGGGRRFAGWSRAGLCGSQQSRSPSGPIGCRVGCTTTRPHMAQVGPTFLRPTGCARRLSRSSPYLRTVPSGRPQAVHTLCTSLPPLSTVLCPGSSTGVFVLRLPRP